MLNNQIIRQNSKHGSSTIEAKLFKILGEIYFQTLRVEIKINEKRIKSQKLYLPTDQYISLSVPGREDTQARNSRSCTAGFTDSKSKLVDQKK